MLPQDPLYGLHCSISLLTKYNQSVSVCLSVVHTDSDELIKIRISSARLAASGVQKVIEDL